MQGDGDVVMRVTIGAAEDDQSVLVQGFGLVIVALSVQECREGGHIGGHVGCSAPSVWIRMASPRRAHGSPCAQAPRAEGHHGSASIR